VSIRRFLRFNTAGLAGIGVQLATLALLLRVTPLPPTYSALLAVVVAITHNFVWHLKWTWADRRIPPRAAPAAFVRFALSNGAVSLLGTSIGMPLLTGAGLGPFAANLVTIAGSGLVNFGLASAFVFGWPRMRSDSAPHPSRPVPLTPWKAAIRGEWSVSPTGSRQTQ
jgi:putative flippase GtrA